jgi:DNA-binding NarL/FixJ family response regulator
MYLEARNLYAGGAFHLLTMTQVSIAILTARGGIRRRLLGVLEADGALTIVSGVSSLEQLTHVEESPDVIVVDAEPEHGVVRAVRIIFPESVLIAVVPGTSSQRLRGALAEGADGVVILERLEQSLVATIGAACAGQVAVPRELRMSIIRPMLSTREKQVLGMVVMGFSNGEIARQLHLAESTIKSHLSSSFTKLGVRSRNEAAELILDADGGLGTGILAISGAEGRG